MRRWRAWWKVAKPGADRSPSSSLGLLTLIGLSVLLASTLGIRGLRGGRRYHLLPEGGPGPRRTRLAPGSRTFFYIAGFAVLFSTNVGIMDWVSRLTADSMKSELSWPKASSGAESKIYSMITWIMCIGGSADHIAGHRTAAHTADPRLDGGRVHDVLLLGAAHPGSTAASCRNRSNCKQLAAGGDDRDVS